LIREDLLSIPGIAEAELDGGAALPAGVKVQLAPGADPDVVGREVRRVLAGHGMRFHITVPAVAPRTPPPPPPPRTVINLADFDHLSSGTLNPGDSGGELIGLNEPIGSKVGHVVSSTEPEGSASDLAQVDTPDDPVAEVEPSAGLSYPPVPVRGDVTIT
jgi:hypothetical protein